MTDFVLKAASQQAMYEGYHAVGIVTVDENGVTVRDRGLLEDGTDWVMLDVGPRMVPSGETHVDPMGNTVPTMIPEPNAYYVILRWNGAAPTPPVPPGVSIMWSSASPGNDEKGFPLPPPEYPSGLTRFA